MLNDKDLAGEPELDDEYDEDEPDPVMFSYKLLVQHHIIVGRS